MSSLISLARPYALLAAKLTRSPNASPPGGANQSTGTGSEARNPHARSIADPAGSASASRCAARLITAESVRG